MIGTPFLSVSLCCGKLFACREFKYSMGYNISASLHASKHFEMESAL